MPNSKIKNKYFSQECNRIQNSEIQNIDDFREIGAKADGVSEGGVYSRVVTDKSGNKVTKKYMLKAMDPFSMASEYIGANIARLYIGDSAPVVDLVRGKDGKLFVASEFIDNFETLKSLSERLDLPAECFPYGCVVDGNGELRSSSSHLRDMIDAYRVNYPEVKDAEIVNIVSDYLQHGDAHDRNVGVRGEKNLDIDIKSTSLIDFSWSLRRARAIGAEVTYNPNYSHNYDPRKTIEAIDQILEITPQEIEQVTSPLFKNLEELYGQDNAVFKEAVPPSNYPLHIVDLAQNAVQKALGLDWGNKQTLQEVRNTMISSLEERTEVLVEEKKKLQAEVMFGQLWEENKRNGSNLSNYDIGLEEPSSRVSFSDPYFIGRENVTGIPHVRLPHNSSLEDGSKIRLLPSSASAEQPQAFDAVIGGMAVIGAIKTLRGAFSFDSNTKSDNTKPIKNKGPSKKR